MFSTSPPSVVTCTCKTFHTLQVKRKMILQVEDGTLQMKRKMIVMMREEEEGEEEHLSQVGEFACDYELCFHSCVDYKVCRL